MLTSWVALGAFFALGCSSDAAYSRDDQSPGFDTSPGGPNDDGSGDDSDAPAEPDDDRLALRPSESDVYVFVANRDRDTITRVEVATQAVRTLRVGRRPVAVAVTRDYGTAVVYNAGDDSVSIVDARALTQRVVPVRDNLNALALAPDGDHAVLWHDVDGVDVGTIDGAAASYQEVSVVDVGEAAHRAMVLGFTPKDIAFTPDGAIAVLVADSTLAVIDLDDDEAVPELVRIADPFAPPAAEEIVLDPSGRWALVRQRDADSVVVVDLAARTATNVPVGADPTDLDLLPDGSGAVVVSRGDGEVAVFDFGDPTEPARVVLVPDGTKLGAAVFAGDDRAVLYSTVTSVARYAVWDTVTDEMLLQPLVKPATSVSRTPTGTSLLVAHGTADRDDGLTPEPYRRRPAISLVSLVDFRSNTIGLDAAVLAVANSADGERGYVTLVQEPVLEILDYRALTFEPVALRSSPEFLGVLPDLDGAGGDEPAAWVSQSHPLGRLSFYDPDDGQLQTITGFELNAAIEE